MIQATTAKQSHSALHTVYKFRPLRDDCHLAWTEDILRKGRFWCSRFWELNDPMEGVYHFLPGTISKDDIQELFKEKSSRVICSFSGRDAFSNPVLWGYYANGFKGIAIEVQVTPDAVHKVRYEESLAWHEDAGDPVTQILTTKLACWKHEDEYRFIGNAAQHGPHKIGTITRVYFGSPYNTVVNAPDAQARPVVQEYLRLREEIIASATETGISCVEVEVRDGRVVPATVLSAPASE
jgi:hypothetical protein